MRVTPEIGRDQRLIGEIENTFERACRSILERLVDLVFIRLFAQDRYEINYRDGHGRYTQRHTIETSFEFGNDQRQSASRAGAGRNDIRPGCASAAQVIVNLVQDALVIGVGMD